MLLSQYYRYAPINVFPQTVLWVGGGRNSLKFRQQKHPTCIGAQADLGLHCIWHWGDFCCIYIYIHCMYCIETVRKTASISYS